MATDEVKETKDWIAYQLILHFIMFCHMQDEITTELYERLIEALMRLKPRE